MNRTYSIKKEKEIRGLLSARKSVGNKYYAIYYKKKLEKKLHLALSVSRKYGNAVERNYAKRVIREIIRKNVDVKQNIQILIVIKILSKELDFYSKKVQILHLINKIINEENNSYGK